MQTKTITKNTILSMSIIYFMVQPGSIKVFSNIFGSSPLAVPRCTARGLAGGRNIKKNYKISYRWDT